MGYVADSLSVAGNNDVATTSPKTLAVPIAFLSLHLILATFWASMMTLEMVIPTFALSKGAMIAVAAALILLKSVSLTVVACAVKSASVRATSVILRSIATADDTSTPPR